SAGPRADGLRLRARIHGLDTLARRAGARRADRSRRFSADHGAIPPGWPAGVLDERHLAGLVGVAEVDVHPRWTDAAARSLPAHHRQGRALHALSRCARGTGVSRL